MALLQAGTAKISYSVRSDDGSVVWINIQADTTAVETGLRKAQKAVRDFAARVRRNGPCPCGSGRKYKRCCLR